MTISAKEHLRATLCLRAPQPWHRTACVKETHYRPPAPHQKRPPFQSFLGPGVTQGLTKVSPHIFHNTIADRWVCSHLLLLLGIQRQTLAYKEKSKVTELRHRSTSTRQIERSSLFSCPIISNRAPALSIRHSQHVYLTARASVLLPYRANKLRVEPKWHIQGF